MKRSVRLIEETREQERKDEVTSGRWVLIAIIFFAVISRLVYLITYLGKNPFSKVLILDSFRYDQWAKAIVEGRVFEQGAFYQAPLYPYFLSLLYRLFGTALFSVYAIQMIIGVFSILLVYLVAAKYFSKKAALFSAAFFALYPTTLFFESKLLPETIALFLSLLLLYALFGLQRSYLFAILGGLLLGLSCLLRPNMLLFFPMIVLWVLFSREHDGAALKRVLCIILFCVGTFIMIFPVTLRNYFMSGDFVLISLNGGLTFCHGNNPYATGIFTPLPGFSSDISQQRMEEKYYAQVEQKKELSDSAISRFWFQKGFQFIKRHPLDWLTLEWKKFFYFFDNYEHSLEYNLSLEKNYMVNISFLPFAVLMAFSLLGVVVSFPWRGKVPLVFYLLVQFLTVMIFYMSSRYRLPAVPVLAIFSGAGAFSLIESFMKKEMRKMIVSLAVVIVIAAFSFMKMGDVYQYEEAAGYGNLGTAFNMLGMNEEAISSFQKQYEIDPKSAFAMFNIGVVLAKDGKEGDAVQYYERAIKINPDLAEAYNNLGVIFVNWGQCADAETLFRKAIELKPFFGNPYNNIATCAFMKGDIEKAAAIVKLADSRRAPISEELRGEIMKKMKEGAQ